jgi:hypothetical protein
MSVIAITIRRDAQRYRWLCCRVRIKLVVSLYPAPESIRPSRESSDARLEAEGKGAARVRFASVCYFPAGLCCPHEVGAPSAGRSDLNVTILQRRGATPTHIEGCTWTKRSQGGEPVSEFSRRALLGGAVATAASVMWNEPIHAQYVWQKPDWHFEEFAKLINSSRRIKQVVHADAINGGRFLRNTKNSLNGLRFGHGVAADQIQIVCGLNAQANVLNYSDYVWQKYHVGEWAKVNDPKTGQPALRNIFYPSKAGTSPHYASEDPSSEDSLYQDVSIQALQSRGVRFVSCHTSTEEQARAFIQQNGLSVQPEEVAKDMVDHALPGVIIVPSLAAALAILQCEGHYSYMAA